MLATRPRNVEQITKAAQTYEYSALVPLRYWLRTAGTMLKEVRRLLTWCAWELTVY
jgi:hypothetical protein